MLVGGTLFGVAIVRRLKLVDWGGFGTGVKVSNLRRLPNRAPVVARSVYLFIYLFIDHNVCSPEAMTWNKK